MLGCLTTKTALAYALSRFVSIIKCVRLLFLFVTRYMLKYVMDYQNASNDDSGPNGSF